MYQLHDLVQMKKPHACGTNRWEIIRLGADIKAVSYTHLTLPTKA